MLNLRCSIATASNNQPKMPNRQFPPPTNKKLSRREFLIFTTLGFGGTVAFSGMMGVGYLALNPENTPIPTPLPPSRTPDPTRQAILKTVQRPPIVSRETWGARPINFDAEEEFGFYSLDNPEGWREYEGDLRQSYQTVVIHHSSVYDENDDRTIIAVQDLHLDQRGWADIGYHFCIGKTGTVYEGRRMSARGTHTELHNTGSLGICLFGNFQTEYPTEDQIKATRALVSWLAVRLRLTHIAGHRDFNSITICPGNNLYAYLDILATEAQLQRGTEGYIRPPEQLITPSPSPTLTDSQSHHWHDETQCGCCANIT